MSGLGGRLAGVLLLGLGCFAPTWAQSFDARSAARDAAAPVIGTDPSSLPDFALFRECDTCPEMVVLPAGVAVTGSPVDEPGRWVEEFTPSRVAINRIAISRFEISWAEYENCKTAGPCAGGPVAPGARDGFTFYRQEPVIRANKSDAETYAAYVSNLASAGGRYRLPTEAEFEYAARAGSDRRFGWGGANPVCDPDVANGANFRDCQGISPWPVGSFQPNAFGIYDLHGSAREWVIDCWRQPIYDDAGRPVGQSPRNCEMGVVKGGAFFSGPNDLRAAARMGVAVGERGEGVGFRLVRDLTPQAPVEDSETDATP